MPWYWGLPLSIIIVIIAMVLSAVVGFNLMWAVIICTALWFAIDSKKINLKQYRSGLPASPILLFVAISMIWVAGFPWYLHVRYKIKHGLAELKEEHSETINKAGA